jgi:hypothetical protein
MKNKYLKENFEPIILISKSLTDVLIKLKMGTKGNSRKTLKKYIKQYNINISHFETFTERNKINGKIKRIPLDEILIKDSLYNNTSHLKNRLYDEGLKDHKCELCGQDEWWFGKKMSLILDHINGTNNDNRLENLRIVCPNCEGTLSTHCRGNRIIKVKHKKIKDSMKISMSQRKIIRPTYSELQKEIKEFGYSGTGRKYGVSDNSIRKWSKFYEKYELLPHTDSNCN